KSFAAAVAGKNDVADGKTFSFEYATLLKRGDNFIHEFLEPIRVFEFPTERIRRVVRSFWHDEHRVLAAGDELLDELEGAERARDRVVPAVEMDDEIHAPAFAKTFRNEN